VVDPYIVSQTVIYSNLGPPTPAWGKDSSLDCNPFL